MTGEPSHSEKKRAAIIEAAITEFHARGFPATSMDSIAESAGVSKRTIYNHFKSKDDLFAEISSEACRRVLELEQSPYCSEEALEPQLRTIARRVIDLVSAPEFLRLVRVTLAERVRRPQVAADAFAEIEKGEFGSTLWIRAATEDGRLLVSDAVAANKQLSALIKEFALWPQLFGTRPMLNAAERNQVVDDAVSIFLARYRA